MNVPLKYEEFSRWLFMGAFVIFNLYGLFFPPLLFLQNFITFYFFGQMGMGCRGRELLTGGSYQ